MTLLNVFSANPLMKAARSIGRSSGRNADRMQIVEVGLPDVRVRRVAIVIACVEAFRISGFGEQLLGFFRAVDRRRRLPKNSWWSGTIGLPVISE
jgi:hypothetical protein